MIFSSQNQSGKKMPIKKKYLYLSADFQEFIEPRCHPHRLQRPLRGLLSLIQNVPEGEPPGRPTRPPGCEGFVGQAGLLGVNQEKLPVAGPSVRQSDNQPCRFHKQPTDFRIIDPRIYISNELVKRNFSTNNYNYR